MLSIGLTGNIGCGKSTVAAMFVELGAEVIDSDLLVHEMLAPGGEAAADVLAAFPAAAGDCGQVDRGALARIAFADERSRRQLEDLLHPRVLRRNAELVDDAQRRGVALVVTEAALLIEAWQAGRAPDPRQRFDALVVVTCDDDVRRRRLAERARERGVPLDTADLERRWKAQAPQEAKAALADHVVDNSNGLEETRRQVRVVHSSLVETGRREP